MRLNAHSPWTSTSSLLVSGTSFYFLRICISILIYINSPRDTVESVGLFDVYLPFTTSNTIIRTFRHAVSLDEHRAKFKANLWHRPTDEQLLLGLPSSHPPKLQPNGKDKKQPPKRQDSGWDESTLTERRLIALERMYDHGRAETSVEEVWFAGCHCGTSLPPICLYDFSDRSLSCNTDVGGGSVQNGTPHTLARISLRWMIRECFKANSGIMFDSQRLREIGLDPCSLLPPFVHLPRPDPLPVGSASVQQMPLTWRWPWSSKFPPAPAPSISDVHACVHGQNGEVISGTEKQEELKDALSPLYDQLDIKWFWWIIEVLPVLPRFQKGEKSLWTKLLG